MRRVPAARRFADRSRRHSFGVISEINQRPSTGDCVKLPDAKCLYGATSWALTVPKDGGTVEASVEELGSKREVIKL